MQIEPGTEWDIGQGEREYCVVNSMQIETGTEWDIIQGNGGIVLPTAFKLELEISGISDREMGYCVSTA
jgi:hypothetical protein